MKVIGTYHSYKIVKGELEKPIIGGGSVKGMNIGMDMKEIAIRIFLHIGQKYKNNDSEGKSFCMDSWGPEPLGWVIEYPTCFVTADQIDGETPPHGLIRRLTEEHVITREYDENTGCLIK